jgi:predicted transcriptional regulator
MAAKKRNPRHRRLRSSVQQSLSEKARTAVERGLADAKAGRFGRPPDLVADAALVRKMRDDT